jgi:hypothetical protein
VDDRKRIHIGIRESEEYLGYYGQFNAVVVLLKQKNS